MKLVLKSILGALAAPVGLFAADVVVTQSITANTTWTSDNVYILDTKIYVENNATLTIQPGTVIKGRPKANPADATALVVTRGAKINAAGTASQPIIFTAEADNLNGNLNVLEQRGLWGGVVLLGRARLNTATGQGNVEGLPSNDARSIYGGDDDDDNSGVMRYVQIRHSGAVVAPNNELNGLTLGGVGRGTTIEYIEVVANNDDGFEWFGGTVNSKYLVSAFNDDDNFDWDEGFRGKGQFWFAIGAPTVGNQAMEMDGGTTPEDGQPYAIPEIYNVTLIGSGATSANTNSQGLIFRDNTGGKFANMILHDYRGYATRIETESAQNQDSAKRLAAGDLWIKNSIFGTFGAGTSDSQLFLAPNATSGGAAPASNYTAEHITAGAQANRINTDPQLRGVSRAANKGLDPRPAVGSPAWSGAALPPSDGFFSTANYIGAFGNNLWLKGWTSLDQRGFVADGGDVNDPDISIIEGSTGKPVNLSARGHVGTGDNVLIAGFVIGGNQQQTIVIRAVGPTIGAAPFNVAGALADPTVEIFRGSTKIAENDNWGGSAALAAAFSRVGAFALPAASADAAIVLNLDPGAYSAIVRGKNGTTGVALIEVYECD
jgi:hypothetical protein